MSNEELINIAKEARKNAYAPLTDYLVGAAILADDGEVYIGANIEVPSGIGISNCAERVAIQNAYAHGKRKFLKLAVVGGSAKNEDIDLTLVPCGVCLQYINEMCGNVDIIHFENGKCVVKKLTDFLITSYSFNVDKEEK